MTPESEFFANNIVLFAALGIIIALILRVEIKRATSGFKAITPTQAVHLINREDAILVDVREDNELGQGSIRNAVHLSLSVLKQRIEELRKHSERPIITYCRSGNRSAEACAILLKHDFDNVMSLKGGFEAWKIANLPVTKKWPIITTI